MSNNQEAIPNIDKDTGIDKSLLSGHHSKESLLALKEANDKGDISTKLFLTIDSTDSDLDNGMSQYVDSLANYLHVHADNEFSDPKDKDNRSYGDSLRKRASGLDKMALDFLEGKPDAFGIQFLYTIKVSMEARDEDTSRLKAYIESKKEKLSK